MEMNDLVLVSVDDHVVEPPEMFSKQLPKDVDQPRVLEDDKGHQYWAWDDLVSINLGLNAVVGRPQNEWGMEPARFDHMRRGTFDVDARIDDMNAAGVLASINYPTFTRSGKIFVERAEKDAVNALRVLQAYNDWHIEEWCGRYPNRLIPLATLPYWDPKLAVEEAKRVNEKGCNAIAFPDNPVAIGALSIHSPDWEPLWALCNERKISVNAHIGSGAGAKHASMDSPIEAWIISMPITIAHAASDWVTLSAFQRYPDLKLVLAEGGIGWIPYLMERADEVSAHHGAWTNSTYGGKSPSDIIREHFVGCYITDRFGLKNRHDIGIDNICLEMDYPHSDSVWPNVPETVWEGFRDLPGEITDAEIDQICYGNASRIYAFDGVEKMGGRENCTVGRLRALAGDVNTTPVSLEGKVPRGYAPGKIVTSGDVVGLFEEMGSIGGAGRSFAPGGLDQK